MKYLHLIFFAYLVNFSYGQYISRSQPAPSFSCPTLCPGSALILEVFQVQNLNNGDTLLAVLSNASGSFTSGTTTLSCTGYSTDLGSTWYNGPYLFSGNVNNLYFSITIPANTPVGSNYTILMKSSSGYTSGDQFSCGGTDYITIISAYPILSQIPANTEGNNQWIGSVYTWTVTPDATSKILNTTALVNEQDFFDTARYKGYFLEDSLSFDINYLTATGGTCPGAPGVLNNGTSIPCSEGFSTDFSIRMLRKENFPTGTYQLSIDGDDGIRLSIDGGNTWLLNTFFEEVYDTSNRSTSTAYPSGICLSGPIGLVIEYFQRNVDSRLTFIATLLSTTSLSDAGNQSVCSGSNVTFQLSNSSNSLSYQWYYSTNGGSTYVPVPNSAPFSGVTTSALSITSVSSSYNNYLFRCQLSGLCGNPVNTGVDTLFVTGNGAPGNLTAGNQTGCTGSDLTFQLNSSSNSLTYRWYYSTDGGSTFIPVPNSAPFSGVATSALSITSVPANYNHYLFRCQVSGLCGNPVNSLTDTLFIGGNGAPATLTANKNYICASDSATICAPANCMAYLWNTGDTTQCINTSLAGDYYATVTYGTGCTGASNHLAINVYPVPSVSITVQGDTLTDLSGVTQQWYSGSNPIQGATSKIYIAPGPGIYSVLITDTNGCQEMSSPINVGETGIAEISSPVDFNLYPNPLSESGQLLVIAQNALVGKYIKVYDAIGQLILENKNKKR